MSPVICHTFSSLESHSSAQITTYRHVNMRRGIDTHAQPWAIILLHPSVIVNFLLGWLSTGRQGREMEGAEPSHAVWENEEEEEEKEEERGGGSLLPDLWITAHITKLISDSKRTDVALEWPLRGWRGNRANQNLCGRDKRRWRYKTVTDSDRVGPMMSSNGAWPCWLHWLPTFTRLSNISQLIACFWKKTRNKRNSWRRLGAGLTLANELANLSRWLANISQPACHSLCTKRFTH